MPKAQSTMMLQLGAQAPEFSLPDAHGELVSRGDFAGQTLVVMFICNHCPFVRHIRHGLRKFALDYMPKGVGIVAINSNDVAAVPQDDRAFMQQEIAEAGYPFAYLVDATQKVAQAYRAACTPDFFLFDMSHKLVYRGQFDDARPNTEAEVTGQNLRDATDRALAKEAPLDKQSPSIGCSIKWLAHMTPKYAEQG